MELLRDLFWLSVKYNFHITARHIRDIDNCVPDALSRAKFSGAILYVFGLCCR